MENLNIIGTDTVDSLCCKDYTKPARKGSPEGKTALKYTEMEHTALGTYYRQGHGWDMLGKLQKTCRLGVPADNLFGKDGHGGLQRLEREAAEVPVPVRPLMRALLANLKAIKTAWEKDTDKAKVRTLACEGYNLAFTVAFAAHTAHTATPAAITVQPKAKAKAKALATLKG